MSVVIFFMAASLPGALTRRDESFAALRFDLHTRQKRRYAGPYVWRPVHDHEAAAAFAYRAEKTARPLHFRSFTVDAHPVGVKGHRYGLSLVTLHTPPVEGEFDFIAALEVVRFENRMFLNKIHYRSSLAFVH
jgi:hypothetical protein